MNDRIAFAMAALALTVLAGPDTAQAQQADTRSGRTIARTVCATCHGTRTGELTSPNPYAPSFENIANTPGMTAAALRVALNSSHRTMPNIILDHAQQRNIIAYILTLKDTN
jgi:mono/diheme cytochrome c family protein